MLSFDDYLKKFDELVEKYLPENGKLSKVDQVVYRKDGMFSLEVKEYESERFEAIKETFRFHYMNNNSFRSLCDQFSITPDEILDIDDLYKIPLIPHTFFKSFPLGADCAVWVGNVFSGPMPPIHLSRNDDIDEMITAFEKAGIKISCSSGTSGRLTMVPRDTPSFQRNEYILAKSIASMIYPNWGPEVNGLLLMPDPRSTCLNIGRVCEIFEDTVSDVAYAVDRSINASDIMQSAVRTNSLKRIIYKRIRSRYLSKVIRYTIQWLMTQEKRKGMIILIGPPFLYSLLFQHLNKEGRRFDFSGRSIVITGGGWKNEVQHEIPGVLFRDEVKKTLGSDLVLDVYGMAEGNIWGIHCPEGHYLHLTSTFALPLVLDTKGSVLPFGERGRFAYLDASVTSFPAFILTGDLVTMYERCPVCGRPGPVLDSRITRATLESQMNCVGVLQRELVRPR